MHRFRKWCTLFDTAVAFILELFIHLIEYSKQYEKSDIKK